MSYIGVNKIGGMHLGSTEISKAYLGNTLVYEKDGVTPVLPYDAEVEYLESSGTQYIDTGFIPDDTCGFYVKACITQVTTSGSQHLFGCIGDVTNSRWTILYMKDTAKVAINWNTTYTAGNYIPSIGVFDEFEDNFLNSRKSFINGTVFKTYTDTLATINRSAYAFTAHNSSGTSTLLYGRIKALKISKGSTIMMDFIPVRVGTTGYLYDKISGTLFGNQGTGDFICGNDVTS